MVLSLLLHRHKLDVEPGPQMEGGGSLGGFAVFPGSFSTALNQSSLLPRPSMGTLPASTILSVSLTTLVAQPVAISASLISDQDSTLLQFLYGFEKFHKLS
jgi:hypothetical protein